MFYRLYATVVTAALCLASCETVERGPSVGGETHWLELCATDDDCGQYTCECGVCSSACTGDDACTGGAAAQCYASEPLRRSQRCGGDQVISDTAICLPTCINETACPVGMVCVQGACLPPMDSGEPLIDDALLDALDRASTQEVAVDWSESVKLPPLPVGIEGADGSLNGVWTEQGCVPDPNQAKQCMTLEIYDDAPVTGIVTLQPSGTEDLRVLAPVADPNVGYPLEITDFNYRRISIGSGNSAWISMRVLDGLQQGEHLSFMFTHFDVWHEWCALQQSYPWHVGGQTSYFCVPQDEQQWHGIDEGKIVLCSSLDQGVLCEVESERIPCACTGPQELDGVRCQPEVCHCNADGCGARLYNNQNVVELRLERGTLVGHWRNRSDYRPVTLTRVSP